MQCHDGSLCLITMLLAAPVSPANNGDTPTTPLEAARVTGAHTLLTASYVTESWGGVERGRT